MAEIWKTAPLFDGKVPALREGARHVRWHFADPSANGVTIDVPSGAWASAGWDSTSSSWAGTATMSEALDLARDGWSDGAEQARAIRDGIKAVLPTLPKLVRWDVAGAVPSVARAVAGNPLNMRRMHMADTRRMPTITLVGYMAAHASVAGSAMLENAAAFAAVVDLLEDAGYRCDVLTVWGGSREAIEVEVVTRVKAPEDVMNLSTFAFCAGHPAWVRRINFAVAESDRAASGIGRGLGQPLKADLSRVPAGTFVVNTTVNDSSLANPQDRFRAICAVLKAQGCPGIPDDLGQGG